MKQAHPLQPEETVQGILSILYDLERYLSEMTGMQGSPSPRLREPRASSPGS